MRVIEGWAELVKVFSKQSNSAVEDQPLSARSASEEPESTSCSQPL